MRKNGVKTMLMGGQACVFYGAAQFSRDLDLLILLDPKNIESLRAALHDLEADVIAVPQFDVTLLNKGHAVHFRCGRADVLNFRIDIMSRLRGLPDFEELWSRRTVIEIKGQTVDILALEDLVAAKKTQRDKDWPMITRLVEQSYFRKEGSLEFWLMELRTPELLLHVVKTHSETAAALAITREAVIAALRDDLQGVADAIRLEERTEREADREYWKPLRRELEELRRKRR